MLDWIWARSTAVNIGTLSAALSSIFWIVSSFTSADSYLKLGALSGPPMKDFRAIQRQAICNSLAAFLSGIAALCGAYVLWKF